jgi:hypothetical protein
VWAEGNAADLVGVAGETADVEVSVAGQEPVVRADSDAGVGAGAEPVVTVLDRFLAAGVSREAFDVHLAAGRIAVAGQRVTNPATPAPPPTVVAIMLDPR